MLASGLAREHAQELLRLEKEELRRLRGIYKTARLEILGRLSESNVPETFTAQHLRGARAQIEAGLRAMTNKIQGRAKTLTEHALRKAAGQTLEEIAYWETRSGFQGAALGRIQTDALRRVSRVEELLLSQFRSSIRAYGENLIGETGRRLGVHLAKRSAWREMAVDVAGRLHQHAITGARWRAERIVRTEMVNALNAGHHAALEASAEVVPGLRKQWDAHLDERTSTMCRKWNGRVVAIDEPFGEHRGRAIMHPPLHPNCRSRVVPWRAAWAKEAA